MIKTKPFLIVGCGRSGTEYISKVMEHHGIQCSHELIFNLTKNPRWFSNEASWLAVPFIEEAKKQGYVIFHQMRDPVKVINSVAQRTDLPYWQYIKQFIPIQGSFGDMAVQYWYMWNRWIGQQADWIYKVESIAAQWDNIMNFIEADNISWKGDDIPTNINSTEPPNNVIKLSSLPQFVKEQIKDYGY